MKRAIVLSGGGGKGAYQIGFWKAIRELKIDFDIVTGTSIGALNGVFLVQGNYKEAFKIWHNMDYETAFEGGMDNYTFDSFEGKKKIISKYAKGALSGGLTVENLYNLIKKHYYPDKFYSSNIDYGLVTVKFPSMKPVMLTKKNINQELMPDYLLASASCFPAFKIKEIDGEKYIDGGYYDNMPINLAIDMGATEVIAVNLKSIGIIKKKYKKDINIKMITPKKRIGNFLVLEKEQSRRAIKYGYNDTMKAFNELDGNYYTFKKDTLKRNYNRIIDRFNNNLNKYTIIDNKDTKTKKILKSNSNNDINKILENTMKAFSIDDINIYRASVANQMLKRIAKVEKDLSLNKIKMLIKKNKFTKNTINKEIILYIYKILNDYEKNKKILKQIIDFLPNSYLCAIYLKTIIK